METRRTFLQKATIGSMLTAANSAGSSITNNVTERQPGRMRTYNIPHTDLTVSRIAYGCAMLTDWERTPLSSDTIENATRVINTAYDNGITFFDLADEYGFGKAELAFGRVLKQEPWLRHNIVIQSKCGLIFDRVFKPGDPYGCDLSHRHIVTATEESLGRLGVDYLDILLLHWPDVLVRPEEVAHAFDELHRSGKVRYFGVSNHTASQIDLLKKSISRPIVANQIHLSLASSSLIAGGLAAILDASYGPHDYTELPVTLDYCRLHDIQIQAYSPLRGELLAPPPNATPEVKLAAQALANMAMQKNSTPPAIALAWLLHHPARIAPIIGTARPEHILEDCVADRVALTDDEWYSLLYSAVKIRSRAV